MKLLPKVAKKARKRNCAEVSQIEVETRLAEIGELTTRGVAILGSFVKNKNFEKILIRNENERIKRLRRLPNIKLDQISSAFYISDQLRLFFENANLGNGIAMLYPGRCSIATRSISGAKNPIDALNAVREDLKRTKKHPDDPDLDPLADLGGSMKDVLRIADPRNIISPLVLERSIATFPILMSLMSIYVTVNRLQTDNGRILVDDHMRKCFDDKDTATRWLILGNDIIEDAKRTIEDDPESKSARESRNILDKLGDDYTKTGLERLGQRSPPNKNPVNIPYDGTTISRSMCITLATYYRIRCIPENMKQDLAKEGVKNIAYGIKIFL